MKVKSMKQLERERLVLEDKISKLNDNKQALLLFYLQGVFKYNNEFWAAVEAWFLHHKEEATL